MKKQNRRTLLVLLAIFTCITLLVMQGAAFIWLENAGARFVSTVGSENTLIRLQHAHKLRGSVLFIGSSITERLLPQKDICSIAMSGSNFTSSLRILDDPEQFKPGTVYIIETNNILRGCNDKILKRVGKWDFSLFRDNPNFSLAAKPSNLIVSYVFYALTHKGNSNAGVFQTEPAVPVDLSSYPAPTPEELDRWKELIAGVEELRRRNGRICFVYLPTIQIERYRHSYEPACKLAKYLDLPVLHYNTPEWINRLEYTDCEHVNSRAESTVKFMNTVARDARIHARP